MLKVKDNVDLKKLAKKYNMTYCQDWTDRYEDDNYGYIVTKDESLFICWRDDLPEWASKKGEITIHRGWENSTLDLLFDLIQAGLVEKV